MTVPIQSLSLLNSDFVATRAARLAERVDREADGGDDARIARAFLLVVGRAPSGTERDAAHRFLKDQPARYAGLDGPAARRRAWVDFCQMLLASDAFLYVE